MQKEIIVRSLKEASACLKRFEAESVTLKDKVAKYKDENSALKKEAEALKIALELILDEQTLSDVNDKVALLKDKNLTVVREAMELDLTKKSASLGKLSDESISDNTDPLHAFYSILAGNK